MKILKKYANGGTEPHNSFEMRKKRKKIKQKEMRAKERGNPFNTGTSKGKITDLGGMPAPPPGTIRKPWKFKGKGRKYANGGTTDDREIRRGEMRDRREGAREERSRGRMRKMSKDRRMEARGERQMARKTRPTPTSSPGWPKMENGGFMRKGSSTEPSNSSEMRRSKGAEGMYTIKGGLRPSPAGPGLGRRNSLGPAGPPPRRRKPIRPAGLPPRREGRKFQYGGLHKYSRKSKSIWDDVGKITGSTQVKEAQKKAMDASMKAKRDKMQSRMDELKQKTAKLKKIRQQREEGRKNKKLQNGGTLPGGPDFNPNLAKRRRSNTGGIGNIGERQRGPVARDGGMRKADKFDKRKFEGKKKRTDTGGIGDMHKRQRRSGGLKRSGKRSERMDAFYKSVGR